MSIKIYVKYVKNNRDFHTTKLNLPTSALDVVSQAQVLRELQALQQKEQTGMVLVTHNLAVLEQMADRVAVLKDGNIVEQGETRTVFDHPKDEYTKNLLAAVPGRGKNDA